MQDVDWAGISEVISSYGRRVKEKSRNIQSGHAEVIYELTVTDEEQLLSAIRNLEQIEQISLLSHDGEYLI